MQALKKRNDQFIVSFAPSAGCVHACRKKVLSKSSNTFAFECLKMPFSKG